ncbi:MAG TPA: cysteine synthase [Actinomycetota bacterium]|nr:cysteine synthase [Actinomycetota bacterium]
MRARDILDAVGNTPLVGIQRLSPKPSVGLWAKLEGQNPTGSLKDRIAVAMVEDAERAGDLTADRIILEPTSGNTGISLALVARRKGYRVMVVIPDNASEERIRLLELYGAEIVFSPSDKGTNGAIEVARRMAEDARYFMPFQYGNPSNPRAHYDGTGIEVLRDLPDVTHFVAGLGTGGTLTGAGRRLKEHRSDIQVIAAEPELGEMVYGLRSLEAGFVPPILDESILDRKLLVSSVDALRATRRLAEEEGLFAGISSGAVLHVATRIASELEEGNVVCLLADGGWKYLSTEAWAEDADRAAKKVGETLWW